MTIRGIGPKRLEKMRKYLTVGKPATPVAPTRQPTNAKPTSPTHKIRTHKVGRCTGYKENTPAAAIVHAAAYRNRRTVALVYCQKDAKE
jgi:hypothetical protein